MVKGSGQDYKTTADIPISKTGIDKVIGQEKAVDVIKKAAAQRRHVFLIGEPGTGKSMLGAAMAELLPKEKLKDILSFKNPDDENNPLIRTTNVGNGKQIVARSKMSAQSAMKNQNLILLLIVIAATIMPYFFWKRGEISDVIYAASMISSVGFIVGFILFMNLGKKMTVKVDTPKVVVDNYGKKHAPFFDASGAHAGALLGDVLHDPFQSGGLGTPAHERVVGGMIHKAHMGVLFIDEIANLNPIMQQELLTAIQEKEYPITGQSERSAGAMVRTEAVPCDFILIAAGNLDTLKNIHPALRSRIRGYGYEIYMEEHMPDTPEHQYKIAQFIAQEVNKDKKIPHFTKDAVESILHIARKRSGRKGQLTLRLRELGGIVRAAGDIAKEDKAKFVTAIHVNKAQSVSQTLEQQISGKYTAHKKEYEVIITKGKKTGRVNGLAVMGSGSAMTGIVLPIESEVTPGGKASEIIATGKLGEIAKEAIKNVSAIIKKFFGDDINETFDIYVQFLQTYEGVEGDSASIAVATTIISSLKQVPIKQDFAMTGSLSVLGEVLPIGGVTYKIEAAIDAGIKSVIIPKSNLGDIVLTKDKLAKIKIIPVTNIIEVLENVLDWTGKESILKKLKTASKKSVGVKKVAKKKATRRR